MSVLARDGEIELIVTWTCQWHCEYCCVDTHNRPDLPFEDVKRKLERIPNGKYVTLSGGEVGALKRDQVEYIINTLKDKQCSLGINTNGLFIKRYRDLLHHFDEVLYHCTEDINVDDEVIIDPTLSLEYLVIVTDNNFHRLGQFLDKYPTIQFNLVAASNPEGISGPVLSPHLKHKMLIEYHTRMTEASKRRIFKEKDFDSITYL